MLHRILTSSLNTGVFTKKKKKMIVIHFGYVGRSLGFPELFKDSQSCFIGLLTMGMGDYWPLCEYYIVRDEYTFILILTSVWFFLVTTHFCNLCLYLIQIILARKNSILKVVFVPFLINHSLFQYSFVAYSCFDTDLSWEWAEMFMVSRGR